MGSYQTTKHTCAEKSATENQANEKDGHVCSRKNVEKSGNLVLCKQRHTRLKFTALKREIQGDVERG